MNMDKIISVYSRSLKSQNSSGPDDPTARLYRVPSTCGFPFNLLLRKAVRYIITEDGRILYTENDTVARSITRDGAAKAEIVLACAAHAIDSTVEELEKDLRDP